jgi:predicted Fe-Mo cluster-binding NifX family protein
MKNTWSLNLALAAFVLFLAPFLASGAEPLLIAVASDDVEATSLVSNTAGRSRYYLLFSGTDFVQLLDNPFRAMGPGATPSLVEYLSQKGVGVVIAGGFGPLMIEAMGQKGMKYIIFSGTAQQAAERVVNFLRPPKKDGEMGTQ